MHRNVVLAVGLQKEDLLCLLDSMEPMGCQVISALSLQDAGWIAGHRTIRLIILDMERLRPDGAQAFQDTVEQNPSMPILILHGEGRTWLSRLKSTVCFQRDARIQDVISVAASLLR